LGLLLPFEILAIKIARGGIWTLALKWRHFVFPKSFLCIRVRVRVSGARLSTFLIKRPFGQVY